MSHEIAIAFDRETRYGLRQPRRGFRYLEARALAELASIIPASPWLLSQPAGDGRKVVVIPGFLFSDGSTWLLRQYLRYLGYDALPWSMGRNRGEPERDAERLLTRLTEGRRDDERMTLIGWSLGGVIARLVARHDPALVDQVITLGTPVEGGPKYTSAGEIFARKRGIDLDAFERHVHAINSEGVERPLTVIYSRTDGVVHWRAAIDRYNAHAKHIRVRSSHLGLGVNPAVWRLIAQTLGRQTDAR
ncbi:MAG: alpha/beta hydrolase [Woeseiaceae bacterium]|nr:alpha/beta hydrolase [Woeseiaceae bacterium]